MTRTVTEAGLTFTDPAAYADEDRLHEAFALLRREDPVHWVEAPGFEPFWAVTRHADIMEIERNNALFLNAPRPLLATAVMDAQAKHRDPNRHLAFGFGVHLCLGAALARMETRAFYAELLPRLESIELAGRPEWTATTFVGGLKHLPIRYTLNG